MRVRVAVGTGCFVALLAACVGGPGPLPDQGPGTSGQGGGIEESGGEGSGGVTGGGSSSSSGSSSGGTKPVVTLRAAEFDQSCSGDADCVAVYEGPACDVCKCPNAAISTKDASRYNSRLKEAAEDCPDPQGDVACAPCDIPPVGCHPDTKKCALGATSSDAGG